MDKSVTLNIVYTGGGTSGHRAPLIAVHQALAQLTKVKAYYIGTKEDIASKDIRALKKYEVITHQVDAGKLRRYWSLDNIKDLFKIVKGYYQAKEFLHSTKIDILFAKGGYVTVPVVLAAKKLKIPIITHESDVVMGLANKFNSRWAKVVCTAYPKEYYRGVKRDKLVCTGNLIREELIHAAKNKSVRRAIKIGGRELVANKPVLLILGGSQGSHRINEIIISLLTVLAEKYIVVHQTGVGDIEWLNGKRKEMSAPEQKTYFPVDVLNVSQLADILKMSSLVISRSGSIVSEIALFGKPAILIPLSNSAGGHQLRNARIFEEKGGAKIIKEENLTPKKLLDQIVKIHNNEKLLVKMQKGMQKLKDSKGAKKVAKIIIKNV